MAFEYSVTIKQGTVVLMNAIVGGQTSPTIDYFYKVTNPGNSILNTSGTNTTDGSTFTNTILNSSAFDGTSLSGDNHTGVTGYSLNGSTITLIGGIDDGNEYSVIISFVAACFNEGTKILCFKNKKDRYVPIEQLQSGDFVKTYKYGYRKIDLIGKNYLWNNPTNFSHCMYKMAKTDTNGLLEDLIVTGGHSILVDDLGQYKECNQRLFHGTTPKIEDKYLLLAAASNEFVQLTEPKKYTYYHFIVENNDDDNEQFGVWANGVLTETPSKNFFIQSNFIVIR
jgi:hypothetical protein